MNLFFKRLVVFFTGVVLIAAQCTQSTRPATPAQTVPATLSPVSLASGEKLNVVATTSIIGDIVKNVAGDAVELAVLLPVGVDPHTFNPAPADLALVAKADVIFINGLGLENFLDKMLENSGSTAPVIAVSQGITPRLFTQINSDHSEADNDGHADENEARTDDQTDEAARIPDPHVWTIPTNAIAFVSNIKQSLIQLDPANATIYTANAGRYRAELETLDAWIQTQTDAIPLANRQLVTDHAVYGYYADRYGLRQVGAVIPSFNTGAEPSARQVAALEETITSYQVSAIFVGNSVNPALSQRIAQDTGVRVISLYTGSLGGSGSEAETYTAYLQYNTRSIVEGLKTTVQ